MRLALTGIGLCIPLRRGRKAGFGEVGRASGVFTGKAGVGGVGVPELIGVFRGRQTRL